MNLSLMKKDLKKISDDFDLKFNNDWFDFMWITKRQGKYLEYIGMCWDTIYSRFGKTINERINNIEKFGASMEFKKIKNEFGGQAITKDEVVKGVKDCKKIKNIKIKNELLDLYKKILGNLSGDSLALLTETNNKSQRKILIDYILFHEWIHILLIKNKIYFKFISEGHWKYDEGLVTYLEYYVRKRLGYLENVRDRHKYYSQKIYFIYAIKFRNMLKNSKMSSERKRVILDFYKKLGEIK